MLEKDIERVLITQEEIQHRCEELGEILTAEFKDKEPLVVGVLKGAVPFMADIIRQMDTYIEIDFMDVSSYGDATVSSGEVKIVKDLDTNVKGRNMLIIEDIIDSGRTLKYLVDLFKYRQANSVTIVTLLDKQEGRQIDIEADYVGFDVPNEFVVGYGLDFAQKYRNLSYVGVLKPSIYESKD
ncbi:MAG TPA: hypoxanthine phosphoribosyltransferase [Tetragenococcus sp.]|nr:hypoxanthine phosphoribosyltransferase [Tetragenococcus sp.]